MPALTAKLIQLMSGPKGRARTRRQRLWRRLIRPAWFGTLRRTRPLSDRWGWDRGTPIDRYYMEHFLDEHRQDIRGHVLEVKDSAYTDRFGTGVTQSDVLDINPANPHATLIADLAVADGVPADTFDCIILTQTLQYIYQTSAALKQVHRILCPGGVLLATIPAICRMDPEFPGMDYWHFTADSCAALFGEVFDQEHLMVRTYGNVLTAIGFLTGIAYEELSVRELDVHDSNYPILVAVRAVKPAATLARR